MSRSLYRAADDSPEVRSEQDERQIVLKKIRRAMDRGLTHEQAVRAVVGNDATARAWLGGA